jgi:hypothetical protein
MEPKVIKLKWDRSLLSERKQIEYAGDLRTMSIKAMGSEAYTDFLHGPLPIGIIVGISVDITSHEYIEFEIEIYPKYENLRFTSIGVHLTNDRNPSLIQSVHLYQ